jgi:hypothetical protein
LLTSETMSKEGMAIARIRPIIPNAKGDPYNRAA